MSEDSKSHLAEKNNAPLSSDEDNNDRIIDGLRYPRQERQIDQLGFETTRHSLKFHGSDWDIPLTQRREELTRAFYDDATDATDECEENIGNLRFVVNKDHLSVRFTVRHRVHIHAKEIQKKLSLYPWSRMKKLYEPRQKRPRTERKPEKRTSIFQRKDSNSEIGQVHRQISTNLSFFGRTQEQTVFRDEKEEEEEPYSYETQKQAKDKSRKVGKAFGM